MSLRQRFPAYSRITGLYPAVYRREYRQQMLQTLADMLDNAPSRGQRARIWLRTIADVPPSLARQHIHNIGGIMAAEMPSYIKRNSIAGGVMLLPFFMLLTVSSVVPQHLYESWFWHSSVLWVWLVILPAAAMLLTLATFAYWAFARRKRTHISLLRSLFDVSHNWPVLAVAILGAGILLLAFGHDSVHCVTGNPIRELRNPRDTWRCIQQD
jgi:hypothetical protein